MQYESKGKGHDVYKNNVGDRVLVDDGTVTYNKAEEMKIVDQREDKTPRQKTVPTVEDTVGTVGQSASGQ